MGSTNLLSIGRSMVGNDELLSMVDPLVFYPLEALPELGLETGNHPCENE